MRGFSLPLYEIRSFYSKFMENDLVILQTRYNRYVLDKPSLGGTYSTRRLTLFSQRKSLPYKIYPLNKGIFTLSQLVHASSRVFINTEGKLVRHIKSKFHNVEVHKVLSTSETYNGKFRNFIKGIPYPLITEIPATHLSLVNYKGAYWVYDAHNGVPLVRKYRVKI